MKTISVDLDGTLTDGSSSKSFWTKTIDEIKPNLKIIEWVKKQYWEGNFIIINTSRKEIYRAITKAWLDKYVIWYNVLVMGKLTADVYLDDRNMKLEEIK